MFFAKITCRVRIIFTIIVARVLLEWCLSLSIYSDTHTHAHTTIISTWFPPSFYSDYLAIQQSTNMSDASGSCLQGILPWWDCSGGGVCVSTPSSPASLITHNVSSSIWNTYNLSYGISADTTTLANHLLMCKCHPDYANVVFLWFISPGDCYVHGLARDVLLWIALLSSALGCVYALLRIACGAPRGRRGCAMSCMAALSLGYPCQPCLHVCMRKSSKDKSVPTTKSSSSLSKHSAAASASGITTSAAAALADWQVIGARGFPMVVAMSLFFLTLYFLGAICAPQILRVRSFYI